MKYFQRFGRENFQEAMKVAHRMNHQHIDWKKFRFEIFDVPTHPGVFQDRYSFLCTHSFFLFCVLF
jgi:hypothetical protein